MFGIIKQLAKNAKSLNSNDVVSALLKSDKEISEYIIYLNTEEQLFDEGINSLGISLESIGGEYSDNTKAIKSEKGQPIDRVTLKDTSDFYNSFGVEVSSKEFEIVADTVKGNKDLRDRWSDEIIGLTDESMVKLILFILPLVRMEVSNRLMKGI